MEIKLEDIEHMEQLLDATTPGKWVTAEYDQEMDPDGAKWAGLAANIGKLSIARLDPDGEVKQTCIAVAATQNGQYDQTDLANLKLLTQLQNHARELLSLARTKLSS